MAKAKKSKKSRSVVQAPKAVAAIADKQTKTAIIRDIAERTSLTMVQIQSVFDALKAQVERHMRTRGSGEFSIPEVAIKVKRVMKKATKARRGRNPATGEEIMIAAKPARKIVKLVAMKSLKAMID